jgi:electron transport complex protein RnfG
VNTEKTIQAPVVSNSKMLQAMVGIAVFCALSIVLTFEGTKPRIEKNKAEALEKAIFRVIPGIDHKRTFVLDAEQNFVEQTEESSDATFVYAGYDADGQLVGLAMEAAGMGFADVIKIIYGYDPEKQAIVGFYVLESKETPGLGDKIEKDEKFLKNFEALDVSLNAGMDALKQPIVQVKSGKKENAWEVDGITGATISSKAIGDLLADHTNYWIPLLYRNLEVFTAE